MTLLGVVREKVDKEKTYRHILDVFRERENFLDAISLREFDDDNDNEIEKLRINLDFEVGREMIEK